MLLLYRIMELPAVYGLNTLDTYIIKAFQVEKKGLLVYSKVTNKGKRSENNGR